MKFKLDQKGPVLDEILNIKLDGFQFDVEYRSSYGEAVSLSGDFKFENDLPYTNRYLINHGKIWEYNAYILELINEALESADFYSQLAEHKQEEAEWHMQSVIEDRFRD